MIKLNSKGTAPDYAEHGSVSTDCKTVGKFMTEAAAIFGGNVTVIVDGCRYEFYDNPKIRVADDTPVGEITYTSVPGGITFIVKTKPKHKTVKRSGWINIYDYDGARTTSRRIFETESGAKFALSNAGYQKVATVRVEWEEVKE